MNTLRWFALACLAVIETGPARPAPAATFTTGVGGMAVMTVSAGDACAGLATARVSAAAVWVDGRYDHELLLFPGSGRAGYATLLGPFTAGRHSVELRPSAFWTSTACLKIGTLSADVVETGDPRHDMLQRAPVLELRADTVGEQTDVPLFGYVEDLPRDDGRTLRYTVVFSNEDGGTQTRALLARWGRTTDIEQVYEVSLRDGRAVREEFQGPDHETRAFEGRRRGVAPVLLVATLNNMVSDRGRGIAAVRPVPELVDLVNATRESTMDTRPWAYRVMRAEMIAEGRIAAASPDDDRWLRVAPDPREHVYLEARLTLDHATAAAWVRDGRRQQRSSHYGRESLVISRNGWVRTAIAVGPEPFVDETGWTCLPSPGDPVRGTCIIEATRAFAFGPDWAPGANRIRAVTLKLRAGEEATVPVVVVAPPSAVGVRPAQ